MNDLIFEIRYQMLSKLEMLVNEKIGPYCLWLGMPSSKSKINRAAYFRPLEDINYKEQKALSIAKAYKLVTS